MMRVQTTPAVSTTGPANILEKKMVLNFPVVNSLRSCNNRMRELQSNLCFGSTRWSSCLLQDFDFHHWKDRSERLGLLIGSVLQNCARCYRTENCSCVMHDPMETRFFCSQVPQNQIPGLLSDDLRAGD